MEECAYLVLGCYGRTENDFVLCPSVDNRILKLDDSLVNIDGIMDYFDSVKLFDRPLLDQNAIRHLIFNIQDRFDQKIKRVWTDHQFNLIERFMHMHKPCGFYVQLLLSDVESDKYSKKDSEDAIFILGTPQKSVVSSNSSIIGIRSRKYG